MTSAWQTVLLVVPASAILFLAVEWRFRRLTGAPLPRGRRLLIPVPVLLFLAANLVDLLGSLDHARTHPIPVPVRSGSSLERISTALFLAGAAAVILLPILLARPAGFPHTRSAFLKFVLEAWAAHIVWFLIPFAILLLSTGVPLQD